MAEKDVDSVRIKRVLTFLDETRVADGRDTVPPLRKAAAVAIIDNPFAGRFVQDLAPLTQASEAVGREICAIAARFWRRIRPLVTARLPSWVPTVSRSTAMPCSPRCSAT